MEYEIRDRNGEDILINNVNRLMVDEENRLFVIGSDNKQLAIYASGSWCSAVNVDPEPEPEPVGKASGAHVHFEATTKAVTPRDYLDTIRAGHF